MFYLMWIHSRISCGLTQCKINFLEVLYVLCRNWYFKYKHDCCILSSSINEIVAHFSFTNDLNGFNDLFKYLDSLSANSEIKIEFEATAHYSMNLKLALEKAGYNFMETNPVLISKLIKSHSLRKTKTDAIDCFSIAKWLMTVEDKPHPVKF